MLPDITHLQFLLLSALIDGDQNGRTLRSILEQQGHKKSAPAFYQLMARMEDAKLVEGRYEPKVVEGQAIKERVYKVTGTGVTTYEQVCAFFEAARNRKFGLGFQGA